MSSADFAPTFIGNVGETQGLAVMGRIAATKKWVKKQSETSRPKAGPVKGSHVRKGLKAARKASNLPSQAKVVNLSIVHGPRELETHPKGSDFAFPYQPLNPQKSEIRVITLHPGTQSSPIECSLHHIPNASKSRASYKALSYTWGAPEPTRILSLDGIQIEVRENLWQALYHVREEETTVRLWVDALCINQQDIPERNEQVSRMGTLYNQAKEVIVWLGPEKDGSDIAISFIKNSVVPPTRGLSSDLSSHLFSEEGCSILDLVKREYWRRVWIIQEVFRARKIIIHCGHEKLQWKDFAKFFRHVRTIPESLFQHFSKFYPRESITALCHNPATTLTDHRTTRYQDLETLLMSYDGTFCCDPRDKVYALLGLAGRRLTSRSQKLVGQNWLTIDYSRSARDLFQELTLMYLAHIGDVFMVRWMQMLQRILGLPPLWTSPQTPLKSTAMGQLTCKTFMPVRISTVSPEFTWHLDLVIDSKAQTETHYEKTELDELFQWYAQFSEVTMPSGTQLTRALYTLVEEDIARLKHSKNTGSITSYSQSADMTGAARAEASGTGTTGLRLFATQSGRLGLTSCDVGCSDELVRFFGCDVAFIVRQAPPGQMSSSIGSDKTIKGRAFILASDLCPKDPSFLTSYNARFRWAIPSSLDLASWYRDASESSLKTMDPGSRKMIDPDVLYPEKGFEMFPTREDDLDHVLQLHPFYWTMSTREWEFWTW